MEGIMPHAVPRAPRNDIDHHRNIINNNNSNNAMSGRRNRQDFIPNAPRPSSNMPTQRGRQGTRPRRLPKKPAPAAAANTTKGPTAPRSMAYLTKYARAVPKVSSKLFDPEEDLIDLSDERPSSNAETVNETGPEMQSDTSLDEASIEKNEVGKAARDDKYMEQRSQKWQGTNGRGSGNGRKPPSGNVPRRKFSHAQRRAEQQEAAYPKTEDADEEIPFIDITHEDEVSDFYRSINSGHLKKRSQNTIFTVPIPALSRHNDLLHRNMQVSLASSDPEVLGGFNLCNDTAQRLLKRATKTDVAWAAQLQRMQDAYEAQLAVQKSMAEKQIKQMQAEVERWQERCESMAARSPSRKK